jgi:glutathione S-transferase
MTLTLYYSPGACSMAPHIVLEEIGAPFEARKIDIAKGEQKTPEYASINPRQKVPALAVDGVVLTEDAAILLYLAARFPEAKLVPDDSFAYGRCVEWLSFLATGVHVLFGDMLHPNRLLADAAQHQALRARSRERLAAAYADIDAHLIGGEFVIGEHFTVADAHLFVFYVWGKRAHLIDHAPALQRWGALTAKRASVIRMAGTEGLTFS